MRSGLRSENEGSSMGLDRNDTTNAADDMLDVAVLDNEFTDEARMTESDKISNRQYYKETILMNDSAVMLHMFLAISRMAEVNRKLIPRSEQLINRATREFPALGRKWKGSTRKGVDFDSIVRQCRGFAILRVRLIRDRQGQRVMMRVVGVPTKKGVRVELQRRRMTLVYDASIYKETEKSYIQ